METRMPQQPLLELKNLTIAFETERGEIRPVRDVSYSIYPGQTLAVVGESGCGKSVTALLNLKQIHGPPGKVIAGQVLFNARVLLQRSEEDVRSVRGRDLATI